MEEVPTVSICWIGSKMGVRALPHDVWVAPGGFDLESSTTFVEPGTPYVALVVFELELFVAPDKRGTSLGARIRWGFENERARSIKTKIKTYGSGQVSQLPVPVPPGVDEYERYWHSSRDVDGQRHGGGGGDRK